MWTTSKIERLRPARAISGTSLPHGSPPCATAGGFEATSDFGRLSEADAILICVPTPLGKHREPDLTAVTETGQAIAKVLRRGQLVVLESTTYPGTTRDVLCPILESSGLKAGDDFFLAFSPEREDPGNPNFSAGNIPKVVGGWDAASGRTRLRPLPRPPSPR